MKGLVAAAILVLVAGPQPKAIAQVKGACEREGADIVGVRPLTVFPGKRVPRKRAHKNPEWPDLPAGTSVTGSWRGELLVRDDGRVARVWSIRKPQLTPDFPPFNQAILDALRLWQYDPWIVSGRATPFCVTVAIAIDF